MTELEFVRSLREHAPRIGDDCAIIPFGSEDLLFTTDLFIEDVHFKRTYAARAVGRKAIVRSLSDIAAMGGTPRWCTMAVAVPEWARAKWLDDFYQGALRELLRYKTELIGGDLAHSDKFTCDVMICGTVPHGKALTRAGARRGDSIFVSGPLGASASRNYRVPPVPKPRIAFAQQLVGKATACMDISDGLLIDLYRLCVESKVGATLDYIPIAPGASPKNALHGGEDYELLFTAPAAVNITGAIRIGTVNSRKPGSVIYCGKRLRPAGYDHFAQL